MAGVVGVLIAVLSMAEGFRATMANTGAPDTAIVLRAGLGRRDDEHPHARGRDGDRGRPADRARCTRQGRLASAELFVIVDLMKASTGTNANAPLRGVEPAAFKVRKSKMLVEGRRFEPGRNEIVVGRAAAAEYSGPGVGVEAEARPERLGGRRHLRRGRHRAGLRAVVRRGTSSRRSTAAATAARRSTRSSRRPKRSPRSRTA